MTAPSQTFAPMPVLHPVPNILLHTPLRPLPDLPLSNIALPPTPITKRRRTTPRKKREPSKIHNGLKTFTMSVVAKLTLLNGPVSYTVVGDQLVADAFQRLHGEQYNATEVDKNIRRRVYDALNVLTSMGFVSRVGKDVEWMGVGGFMRLVGMGGLQRMKKEIHNVRKRLEEKTQRLNELKRQRAFLESVIRRNVGRDVSRVTTGCVGDSLEYVGPDPKRVALPFLLLSAGRGVSIAVEMDEQREQVAFRFNGPFKVSDGYDVVGMVCNRQGVR